jgi:hypothetical protein
MRIDWACEMIRLTASPPLVQILLGFSAGPLVGGVMLQLVGGPKTFVLTVLIIVLGGLSYWQSSRMAIAVAA